MKMGEEEFVRELLQRLTRIEENTKGIKDVEDKADRALTKADKAYSMALTNEKSIKEIKANNKWAWGFVIGLAVTIVGYFFTNF